MEKTLTAISKEQKAAGDEDPVLCFTAKEIGGGITDQVRKLFKLGNATKVPQAVLADFPSGGKFSVIEGADNGGNSDEQKRMLQRACYLFLGS